MTYSKSISAEKMASLAPIISRLEAMKPGDELPLRDSNENLAKIRSWFYNWLWIENKKSLYKVIWKNPELLVIRKLNEILEPTILDPEDQQQTVDYVVDTLMDYNTEDQVIQKMREDEVNARLRLMYLKEWRRLQGIEL